MALLLPERTRLLEEAQEGLARAYAPYSRIKVGAALLTEKGQVFSGGNIENASYGLSLCAEGAAIALAAEGFSFDALLGQRCGKRGDRIEVYSEPGNCCTGI
jgi:homotetrameric cytidine deaminase